MSAPALILLSPDRNDPGVARVGQELRQELLAIRPQLDVGFAFLGDQPSLLSVAAQLAKRGIEEAVLVPLLLSDAFASQHDLPPVLAQVRAAQPKLEVIASRPVGPEAQLLAVIDRRLRDAIRARRVSELDGLVFSAAGSTDVRSNALVVPPGPAVGHPPPVAVRDGVRRRFGPEHRRGDPHPARAGPAAHRRR